MNTWRTLIQLPRTPRVSIEAHDDPFYGRALVIGAERESHIQLFLLDLRRAVEESLRTFNQRSTT